MRSDGRIADVTVAVRGSKSVLLTGIEMEEQRPGWLCMRLPPEADWQRALSVLKPGERSCFQDGEFYERLRAAVATAFVKHKQTR